MSIFVRQSTNLCNQIYDRFNPLVACAASKSLCGRLSNIHHFGSLESIFETRDEIDTVCKAKLL